ncbi:MAG: PilZ domain-containing protein [Rhizobiales bacterium]|nr:PilZ domain-containing protein [Hyphomicrobiales bacterium]
MSLTKTAPANRRATTRYAFGGVARIEFRPGTLPRECRLTDISDGGVRLFADGMEIPDRFTLLFPDKEGTRRECRVVWRLGPEVGAEFTDSKLAGFGKRMGREKA